jgi:hypothetical protein
VLKASAKRDDGNFPFAAIRTAASFLGFLFSALLELPDMRAEPLEEHRQRLEQLLHCKARTGRNR